MHIGFQKYAGFISSLPYRGGHYQTSGPPDCSHCSANMHPTHRFHLLLCCLLCLPLTSADIDESCLVDLQFPFPTLNPWLGVHLSGNGSSEFDQCSADSRLLLESFRRRKLWAVRMVDASARQVSGSLWGCHHQLGSFDACVFAGPSSPVGARYCLLEVSVRHAQQSAAAPANWLSVDDLSPNEDAAAVFNGAGQLPGFSPPGEVFLAQCVPRSCGPAALEAAAAALRPDLAAAGRPSDSPFPYQARVSVKPPLCTAAEEVRAVPWSEPRHRLFWSFLALLSAASFAAPSLGWSWWDWRRHLRSLQRPDAPLQGLDLAPLSGIRFLTVLLITGAHRAALTAHGASSNQQVTVKTLTSPLASLAFNGQVFIGTFLFLSGVLTMMTKSNSGSVFKAFLIRLFRCAPLYFLMIFFVIAILPDIGSGPLWKLTIGRESAACGRRWWPNVLFINNYVPFSRDQPLCMLHSWFMALDMQLFLLCALLRPAERGWRPLVATFALSLLPPFVGTVMFRWPAIFPNKPLEMDVVQDDHWFRYGYVPTHMRATAFIVGLITGKVLLHLKQSRGCQLSARASWLGAVVGVLALGAVLLSSLVLLDPHRPYSALQSAAYASLAPALWSGALGLLVVSVVLGEQTLLRDFLSWQPMVTLSRLGYGMYLTCYMFHKIIIAMQTEGRKINEFSVIYDTVSDLVLCFMISLLLHFILEAPVRLAAKEIIEGSRETSKMSCPSRTSRKKQHSQ